MFKPFEQQAATLTQAQIIELLQAHEALHRCHQTLHQKNQNLQTENDQLNAQLDWFKRQLFGRKSEKRLLCDNPHQLNLEE